MQTKKMTIQRTLGLAVLMACNAQLANAQFLDNIQILEDAGVGTAIILDNVNPNVDWYLQNNNLNGDLFFVSYVNNVLNGIPLSIDENAGDDALYLGPSGAVGVGTLTPGGPLNSKLSVADSAGVASVFMDNGVDQWSMGASSEGAFIAEGTTSYLSISSATGFVAIAGDTGLVNPTPEANLHVISDDDTFALPFIVENVSDAISFSGFRLQIAADSWIDFNNSGGNFRINSDQSPGAEFEVQPNGNAIVAGTLTELSDVNSKKDIHSVDQAEILERVMQLQVSEWSYKDEPGIRHVGPMAQDFYAAFGLGATEKGISGIDSGGIALAAIQGVKGEKDVEIAALKAQLAEQRDAMADQEKEYSERILQLEMMLSGILQKLESPQVVRLSN